MLMVRSPSLPVVAGEAPAHGEAVHAGSIRFLSERFRSFYAILRDLEGEARSLGTGDAGTPAVPRRRIEDMIASLVHHLSEGQAEALRLGGAYGATLYQDAAYAMAALADETFLFGPEWGGRAAWDDILVEARLCGTRLAGERVFERIEGLLAANEPAHAELAGIFLMVLSLGFQGRYRDAPGGAEVLASTRRRLSALAGGRAKDGAGPLFPEAYANTLDAGVAVGLPPLHRWVWLGLGLLVGYLVVSHLAWWTLTGPVRAIISGAGG